MGKTKESKNNEERSLQKTAFIVELAAAGIAVLVAILYLMGVFPRKFDPMYVLGPAIAVMMGSHGIREWKSRKLLSIAVFILGLLLIAVAIKRMFV